MIKNIFIQYSILIGIIITGLLGDQEKFVVRIHSPTEGVIQKYRSPEYDMAAYKPGEYLDLVVDKILYKFNKNLTLPICLVRYPKISNC